MSTNSSQHFNDTQNSNMSIQLQTRLGVEQRVGQVDSCLGHHGGGGVLIYGFLTEICVPTLNFNKSMFK